MKFKIRQPNGEITDIDTKFDWGYKTDGEFVLDLLNEKFKLQGKVKQLEAEIKRLKQELETKKEA